MANSKISCHNINNFPAKIMEHCLQIKFQSRINFKLRDPPSKRNAPKIRQQLKLNRKKISRTLLLGKLYLWFPEEENETISLQACVEARWNNYFYQCKFNKMIRNILILSETPFVQQQMLPNTSNLIIHLIPPLINVNRCPKSAWSPPIEFN